MRRRSSRSLGFLIMCYSYLWTGGLSKSVAYPRQNNCQRIDLSPQPPQFRRTAMYLSAFPHNLTKYITGHVYVF